MVAPALDTLDLSPLTNLLGRAFPGAEYRITPMPGGASLRRYFRVQLVDGRTAVAMYVPEGALAEEIEKGGKRPRWPFLEVRDLLAERGVDVPALYGEDCGRGWLLLEDLSDNTLAVSLANHPQLKPAIYTQAVVDLARAQGTLAALPNDSVVATRSFDVDLLFWELEHFREYGLLARGKSFAPGDATEFERLAREVAQRIASFPNAFTHRDYQSRNLMVRRTDPPQLVWIDFQDALIGPRVYDLVALLNDSYQEFTEEFVAARLDDFARAKGLDAAERLALGQEFDLVTVQRKLKDAGRFIFINQVKGNPSFLQFVLPTLKKAERALERLSNQPSMAALLAILRRAKVFED